MTGFPAVAQQGHRMNAIGFGKGRERPLSPPSGERELTLCLRTAFRHDNQIHAIALPWRNGYRGSMSDPMISTRTDNAE